MKQSILRRFGAFLLALAMVVPLAVTPAMAADFTVSISSSSNTVSAGGSVNLTAELTAADSSTLSPAAYDYEWSSSDEEVAVVGAGFQEVTVDAKKAGTATITVKVTPKSGSEADAVTMTYVLTVGSGTTTPTTVPVTGVTLDRDTLSLTVRGGAGQLTAKVAPDNATNQTVNWTSSDPSVATVDDIGKINPLKAGDTTITATTADGGFTATCKVTVNGPAATGISFSIGNSLTLSLREQRVLTLSAQPSDAEIPAGTVFESSNPDVVTVAPSDTNPSQATVTAVSPGEATVTAKLGDATATLTVKVSGIVITYDGQKVDTGSNPVNLVEGDRKTLVVQAYGAAEGYSTMSWESDNNAVAYVVTGGSITARASGTAMVTVVKKIAGGREYTASCTVRVSEDNRFLISVSAVNAGTELSLGSISSRLNSIAASNGFGSVNYVTNLSVDTDQGILYYGYYYEGDTGDGVGMEKYYLNPNTNAGQLALSELGFVGRTTFSGTAVIRYTAWCGSNSFSGEIRVPVNAMNDVVYSTTRDRPVTFQANDFNTVCRNKNGRDLRNVTFTIPQASQGTLYYDYDTLGLNGQQVTSGTAYGRNTSPYIDSVTFVPAANCPSVVTIGYTGYDVSNRAVSGRVTINITGSTGSNTLRSSDVRYNANWGDQVIFRATDFASACQATLNEALSYVRFNLPYSSQGTLYFNYNSSGVYGSAVSPLTSYYASGAPAIGGVSFVPATTATNQVTMTYTAFGVRGNTYTGTIYINYGDSNPSTLRYTTYSGKRVNLSVADFNNACITATGSTLDYVQFTGLPGSAQGVMYYNYDSSKTYNTQVYTGSSYYRTSSNSQNLLSLVSFMASKTYTGTVNIPYTGWSTDKNRTSFTGTVVIQVAAPAPSDINLTTSSSSPVRMSTATVRNACYAVMDQELSYIQIASLPASAAGTLYSGYNGTTGNTVGIGSRFYRAANPTIDQLTFVPKGGYTGVATIGYTGVGVNGQQVSGRINIYIDRTGTSSYFNDMGSYAWAADAVDYLYRMGVVNGMGNGGFGPSQPIRRCDFIVMLCRAFKLSGSGGYSFADVPVTSYYAEAVATAKSLGIIQGDGRNFYPNSNLSRQDAMVMIYNTLEATGHKLTNGLTADLSIFLDQGQISPYARNSVGILVYLGAVKGDGNGYLRPRSTINRAEAAILTQFIMAM